MKERNKSILLVAFVVLSIVAGWWFVIRINTDFASEAKLEFHHQSVPGGDNPSANISIAITDEDDMIELKKILRGNSLYSDHACGFTSDVSVTMTNGSKSIMICPARDGCPVLRIGDPDDVDEAYPYAGWYLNISKEQRLTLDKILEKYGAYFPVT